MEAQNFLLTGLAYVTRDNSKQCLPSKGLKWNLKNKLKLHVDLGVDCGRLADL